MTKIQPTPYCLQGHHGAVTSVAFTPAGNHILSAGEDGTLRLWERATQRQTFVILSHTPSIYGIASAAAGTWVAAASQAGEVLVLDWVTQRPLARFQHGLATGGHAIACSAEGRYLLLGNDDGLLWRWEWQTGAFLCLLGHTRPVVGVALAADGELAVSLAHDATLCVWHLGSGSLLRTLPLDSNYREPLGITLALSPDGRLAATSSSAVAVDIWDLATGQRLATLDRMIGTVWAMAFLPDGNHLLTASSVEGIESANDEAMSHDHSISLWDIASGNEIAQFVGHRGRVHSMAVSPDGKHFVSGSSDQTICLWDLYSRLPLSNIFCGLKNVT